MQARLSIFTGQNVARVALSEVSASIIKPQSIVISTIELYTPLLMNSKPEDLKQIKILTNNASTFLWITGGNLYKAGNPSLSLVLGLSRALMLEQPSLRFIVFDIENTKDELMAAKENLITLLERSHDDSKKDYEFFQQDGLLYISRFYPDTILNKTFSDSISSDSNEISLREAGRCRLSMKYSGQINTIEFIKEHRTEVLTQDHVEVHVKSIGINAKVLISYKSQNGAGQLIHIQDLYVLGNQIDTKDGTSALEFSGIITRIGATVSDFKVGDRVLAMAPNHFRTYEYVPEWACCKLSQTEGFSVSLNL